jgi:hypothetical protein
MRRMRWAGHVPRMHWGKIFRNILGGPMSKVHWEDLDVGGIVTLKWTLGR